MKKFSLTLFLILATFVVFSQVPNTFNYQAVVRNSSGEIISNHSVSFRISILENSESGTVVYSETHTLTTNAFGLVNFKIGNGDNPTGTFSPTGWGVAPHFVKIEFDPAGGTAFTELATNKLASVPYAFTAENVVNDAVDDADADPENEIQQLSLNGTLLELSNGGGSVTLPTSGGGGGDNWGAQTVKTDATLTGNGTSTDPLKVVGDLTDDQTLSLSGNDLTISDGNTVTLPASDSNLWTQNGNILSYPSGTVQIGNIPITNEGVLLDVRTTDKPFAFYAENNDINSTIQIRNLGTGGAAWFHNKIKISDGTQGAGKVLTSDADGNSSWQTPATSSSLWTESGSNIYRGSGNVAIGGNPSTAKLYVFNRNGDPSIVANNQNGKAIYAYSSDNSGNTIESLSEQGTSIYAAVPGLCSAKLCSQADNAAGYFNGNLFVENGLVGIGTTTPSAPLEIKSNNEPSLIIGSASGNFPTRPGIKFINNTSQYIAADDGSDEIFGFYSKWGNTRTYDAKLRVYGKASSSWGNYMEFTHDGTNGKILTDIGDITISPASKKVKIDGRITSSTSGNDADLKAYAYGTIKADGTINSGTGNFSVDTGAGTGIYKITFLNESYDKQHFVTILSISGLSLPKFIQNYSTNGTLVVRISATDGAFSNNDFSFVTYKK